MSARIRRGQIRLDTARNVPIKIGNKVGSPMQFGYSTYRVRDIITGESYSVTDYSIGRELSEMEVVAWAAK